MTDDKAIKVIKNEKACVKRQDFCDHDCGNCDLAMTDSDILAAYNVAINAIKGKANKNERLTPKPIKVVWWTCYEGADYDTVCPTCGKEFELDTWQKPFCANCGQALNWDCEYEWEK